MSGFRASLKGAQSIVETKPDIVSLGKVIGAGMPVGAFGARAEIMAYLSPEGPVYQAGTLSGNPVAMTAGYTSLRKLKDNPDIYDTLQARATRLMQGFKEAAAKHDIPFVTEVRGSMFGFFFSDKVVKNFADACDNDTKMFAKFHKGMLDRGVYLACSSYETGFISTATTDEMIEEAIKACEDTLASIKQG